MTGSFDISTAANTIQIEPDQPTETAFTVFNPSATAITGRALLVAENPVATGWVKVNGELERKFPAHTAEHYLVQIVAPPDAPGGTYLIRLNMVGVENPDEDFTQGPTVAMTIQGETNGLALKGAAIQDPLAVALRNQQPTRAARRGCNIGLAAAEGDTLPGPGKQAIHDALDPAEQGGYTTAVTFSLERNRNAEFAGKGAAVARLDPVVAQARTSPSVFYTLGFDIATGLFGDVALGGSGHTSEGPGANAIRDSLSPDGQAGYRAAVQLYLVQKHKGS